MHKIDEQAGRFRNGPVYIRGANFTPPPAGQVESLLNERLKWQTGPGQVYETIVRVTADLEEFAVLEGIRRNKVFVLEHRQVVVFYYDIISATGGDIVIERTARRRRGKVYEQSRGIAVDVKHDAAIKALPRESKARAGSLAAS